MDYTAQEVAKKLLDAEAVKVSIDPPFTWTSGIKSPIYCDNRKLISHVEARDYIVSLFVDNIEKEGISPDYIAGTATAAIPWASFVAYEMKLPLLYIRPEKKGHGAGKQIEGDLKPGSKVVLLEDLVSTGGSCVKAVQALREEGQSTCDHVFAIVSWGLDVSLEAFEKNGVSAAFLTDYQSIIAEALNRGALPENLYEKVLEFKDDPKGWWDKFSA
jgi:orotate phosphoribosyltransferase